MGGTASRVHHAGTFDSMNKGRGASEHATVWRKEGYHDDFTKSPLIPDDKDDITEYVELLAMLHSPTGQNFLGQFSIEIGTQYVLFAWSDIQEYRAIPTADYRFTKAKQIFGKYLRSSATNLDFLPEVLGAEIYECITQAREDRNLLGEDLFLQVQKGCFRQIFSSTFLKLKESYMSRYVAYQDEGAERYNRIDVDDFWYMEKLGEGTFGKVVHVVKKSTGKHYAMKIQHKSELLRIFGRDLNKLDNEKMVLQACNHPFVLQMHYAFQTELHAIIVLNLVTTGNLQDAIDSAPKKRLEEPRSRFYAAEIAVALMHLHDMGLMYRDLKPQNVMLGTDGHIQLADMGGVEDCIGDMSARKMRKHGATVVRRSKLVNFKTKSILGSMGYMAPEMAKLLNQSNDDCQGYDEAVDWWSLGATVYKMLTGMRPFDPPPGSRKKSMVAQLRSQTEFEKLQARVDYPGYMSEAAVAFVSALLRHAVEERLGSGPEGEEGIKSHPFMAGIPWDRLAAKSVDPPFVPPEEPLGEKPLFKCFEGMMLSMQKPDAGSGRKERGAEERIDEPTRLCRDDQKWFSNWRYIGPQTLRIEMGLSQAMADIENNYKVIQLTGETSLSVTAAPNPRLSQVLTNRGKVVVAKMGKVLSVFSPNASDASSEASARDDNDTVRGTSAPPSLVQKMATDETLASVTSSASSKGGDTILRPKERPIVRPRITLKKPEI